MENLNAGAGGFEKWKSAGSAGAGARSPWPGREAPKEEEKRSEAAREKLKAGGAPKAGEREPGELEWGEALECGPLRFAPPRFPGVLAVEMAPAQENMPSWAAAFDALSWAAAFAGAGTERRSLRSSISALESAISAATA